jgi:pyrophosphatase PpaX
VSPTDHLPYEAVLFDLDATLADSRPIYEQAFAATFKEVLGLALDEHERRQYMGLPTADFLMQYAEGEQLVVLLKTLTAHVNRLMPDVQLFSGFDEVLPALQRAGLGLGVVTSQNQEECSITRRSLGIDEWIDVWITVEDVERVKPDPQPVEAALWALQVRAERTVFVGDSIFDLKAGRAAGTRVAAAAWGAADLDQLLAFKPDHVFRTPSELRIFLPD